MKIASFLPLSDRTSGPSFLLSPIHALMAYFLPASAGSAHVRRAVDSTVCQHTPVLSHPVPKPTYPMRGRKAVDNSPVQRLKVVRQFEPGVSRSCAGRLVISGRMSDVCAELERMAGQQPIASSSRSSFKHKPDLFESVG